MFPFLLLCVLAEAITGDERGNGSGRSNQTAPRTEDVDPTAITISPEALTECPVTVDSEQLIAVSPLYHRQGAAIGTTFITFRISRGPSVRGQRCAIRLEEIAQQMNFIRGTVYLFLILKCTPGTYLDIIRDKDLGNFQDNTLVFLNIQRCMMDVTDLFYIAQLARLDTIFVSNTNLLGPRNSYAFSDLTFPHLRTLALSSSLWPLPAPKFFFNTTFFQNITKLTLQNVLVRHFPNDFKGNFPNLLSLSCLSCHLKLPPSTVWDGPSSILPLELSLTQNMINKNMLQGIHVAPNEIPRVLQLVHNKFYNLTATTFHGKLHSIVLNSNQIKLIGEDTFSKVRGLQSLHLAANVLGSIPPGAFNGLTELVHLDLSNNVLTHLHPDLFRNLTGLWHLDLSSNRLGSVPAGTLSYLPSLITLNLAWNGLTSIDPGVLPITSPVFSNLVLNRNPLETISAEALVSLSLRLIDLSFTRVNLGQVLAALTNVSLDKLTLSPGRAKPILLLRSNNIKQVPAFVDYKSYTDTDNKRMRLLFIMNYFCIDLSENILDCNCDVGALIMQMGVHQTAYTSDQPGPVPLPWGACYKGWECGAPSIYSHSPVSVLDPHTLSCPLDLSGCPEACVCKLSTDLQVVVDCSNRQLGDGDILTWPREANQVWLQNNGISRLPTNFTTSLQELSMLVLSNNSLENIPDGLIVDLKSLTVLYLDNNNLQRIPRSMKTAQLQAVKLANNNLFCDCENKWLKQWLLNNRDVVLDWESVECLNSSNMTQRLAEVPSQSFGCPEEVRGTGRLVTSLSVPLALVALIAVALSCFHREVRACASLWLWVPLCGRGGPSARVFLVCSDEDDPWAQEKVTGPLSGHRKVSCVISRNDFKAGFTTQENVLNFLKESTATVLVMSKQFYVCDLCIEVVKLMADNQMCRPVIVGKGTILKKCLGEGNLKGVGKHAILVNSKSIFFKQLLTHAVISSCPEPNVALGQDVVTSMNCTGIEETIPMNTPSIAEELEFELDVSVLCGDAEWEWTRQAVIVPLREAGYRVGTAEEHFIPGEDHADNIENLMDRSRQLLLVVSRAFLDDEWSTFVFRAAVGLNANRRTNYLCVLKYDDILLERGLGDDIDIYLKSHVCIQRDKDLLANLSKSLQPPLHRI